MGVHTEVGYEDLSLEKKEELIDWVKQLLIENYLEEGQDILNDKNRRWYVEPRTKEEAYCRVYDIGAKYWPEDEKSQEFKDFDWTYQLTEHAEEQAEEKLYDAFKYLEVEIDLS